MNKCYIITGGELSSLPKNNLNVFTIACDKGYEYALSNGIKCDLVIGDFDSYRGSLPSDKVVKLNPEKDDTDTMSAVRYALERELNDITIFCALGDRLDHTYANLQIGTYIVNNGGSCSIISETCSIYFLRNTKRRFDRLELFSFSVFSVSDRSEGVSIQGAKYPLENATLDNAYPIGVSNEWVSDYIDIEVKNGTIMVMTSRL